MLRKMSLNNYMMCDRLDNEKLFIQTLCVRLCEHTVDYIQLVCIWMHVRAGNPTEKMHTNTHTRSEDHVHTHALLESTAETTQEHANLLAWQLEWNLRLA